MKIINCCTVTCLAASVLAMALISCSKKEPVRLGFIGGLTGRGADLGTAGRNGAILAVEERNAAGGIKGRKIELIVRDDEQNPDTAKRMATQLLDQQVAAIIGPMTSSMAMAILPVAGAAKTVLMSPTVTTSDLTGKDDHFFRVISDTQGYASKNARYMFEKLGHRSAAVIYDLGNKAYTESWSKYFNTTFEGLGGKNVATRSFQSGSDTAFTGTIAELMEAKPDLLVIIANAVDAALICQQARKSNPKIQVTMAEWASTERFMELAGTAAEGAYMDQYFNRNDTSDNFSSFLHSYRKRFSMEPGFAGVAAYDAANVIMAALARKGAQQTLREFILASPKYQGVQQEINFDRYGDSQRKTYISTIRNGKITVIE